MWAGDARDGFNGGGDFVRWVADEAGRAAASAWFRPRCDRVRVQPFLDGVPCSVHGFVLPDGTAVFRPVEIAVLRGPGHRFVYGGLGTTWDPPAADREQMRTAARRVGEHLRAAHGYRGAFGIDGVLTTDGFRPTELNTRLSGGLVLLAGVDLPHLVLLQAAATSGWHHDVGVAELEELVPLMDATRVARTAVVGQHRVTEPLVLALDWDGERFSPAADQSDPRAAADVLLVGPTPSGFYAKVEPCAALSRPGERVARVNAALVDLLDREVGTTLGPVAPAPDVRTTSPQQRGGLMRVVVVGGGYGGMAAAARLAKLGHEVTLLERSASLGGALETVEREGFTWQAGPTSMLLPAVARDLFRKSGRPLEAELRTDLEMLEVVREHRFADDTAVRLPGGSRAAQLEAFDAMEPGTGQAWVDHVAAYDETWEVLRRHYLEVPWTPDALPREVAAVLGSRESLQRRLRRSFRDERLRMVAGHPFTADGHALRDVPAWAGLVAYLEQRFGAWTVPGGMHLLGDRAGPPAGDPAGHGRARQHRARPGRRGRAGARRARPRSGRSTPTSWCVAVDPRLLPDPAPAGRAHHARAAADDVPPRARGRGAGPAGRGGAARRPDAGRAHRRHRTGRPRRLDAAGSRPPGRGRRRRAGPPPHRRPRAGGGARRPQPARAGRALGRLAVGRAVAGPRHGAAPARTAHAGRRGVRRRRPRDAGRGPAVRRALGRAGRPGGRTGLSRREPTGAGGEPSDRHVERGEDLQRRLRAVQRVEVQAGRAAGEQLLAQLGGHGDALGAHGGRVALVGARSARPPRRAPRCRSARPGDGWRLRFRIGMMPGRIGMSTPRARTRSTSPK